MRRRRKRRDKSNALLWQIATDVSAAGAPTFVMLALGEGVAKAIAGGTVPVIAPAMVRIAQAANRQRQNFMAEMLNKAADYVGGLDILEERVYSHNERVILLARVLQAAADTIMKEKFRALSRVLAEGLRDDADIGEAFILAAALGDIEAHHVEVLRYIRDKPIPPPELRSPDDENPRGWEAKVLARALSQLTGILDGLVAVLTRHGLLIDVGRANFPGTVGPAILAISRLGERVLFLLSEEVDWLNRQEKDGG
jgi:hypothetical protein